MKTQRRYLATGALVGVVSLLAVFCGAATRVAAQIATAAELRQQSFEIVWRTVKEKHFDPTLGGLNWDEVRDRYAPQVARAKSDDQFYDLLSQMIGELHQSHFRIMPPGSFPDDDTKEPQMGSIGISLRLIDGKPIITRVEAGSSAASAGLRTGFVVKKVDGVAVGEITARYSSSKESASLVRLLMTRAIYVRTMGKPETVVRITYDDQDDRTREVSVVREKLKGSMSPAMGNFPPQYLEFESKRLAGDIGYIRFNIFVTPQMEKIREAIRSMRDARGLIIDLRGNPGGVGAMAMGLAGMLSGSQGSLGALHSRNGSVGFVVFPQTNAYLGPLVILIDESSASTSEIFANGMQENGRAIVVGQRSAGAALPSVFEKLPTGALFQYAIADFKTPKGVLIEGRGVIPDVEVNLTRRSLLEGRDAQLDAGIERINKQSKAATSNTSAPPQSH